MDHNKILNTFFNTKKINDKKNIPFVVILVVGIAIIFDLLAVPIDEPRIQGAQSNVVRVVDGDTIRVLIDGEEKTIRLIGIDTPETKAPQKPVECFGQEATEKLVNLLDDEEVILESDNTQSDQDRYGRLLRYVFLQDGTNVNLEMIKQGYAYEYTYGAPYIYQNEFKQAQQEAQLNDRGLWSPQTCDGKRE